MEFNSFDMDIQSDEFTKEYEDWLDTLEEEGWLESLDEEVLNRLCGEPFDYDQWLKDCEETLWHIGKEETKLFG